VKRAGHPVFSSVRPGECNARHPKKQAPCGTPRFVLVPSLRPTMQPRMPLPLGPRKDTHGAGCHQPRLRRPQLASRWRRLKSTSGMRRESDCHIRPICHVLCFYGLGSPPLDQSRSRRDTSFERAANTG